MKEIRTFPRFGPYVIVRVSGAGGMGRVELALRADAGAAGVCVVKRMLPERGDAHEVARFRREAQIASRLRHPNIARTLRVEQIAGELCIAQEFVEGMDFGTLIRQLRAHLPIATAVHVAREVAAALAYAHDFGGHDIVHRDVTPENILLSYDGDVKLIDFGIARSTVDGTLTNAGVILGRREYIAPEAWDGARPDRRIDVYALGVVLWEALTGRRLEGTREAVPARALPHAGLVNPAVPTALGDVVARALAPDPAARYQTVGALDAALAPFSAAGATRKHELAELLRFHFNVPTTRAVIAADIAGARRFLAAEARAARPAAAGASSRRLLAVGLAGALAASAAAGALLYHSRIHPRSVPQQGQKGIEAP